MQLFGLASCASEPGTWACASWGASANGIAVAIPMISRMVRPAVILRVGTSSLLSCFGEVALAGVEDDRLVAHEVCDRH